MIGKQILNYQVLEHLGGGGMGVVYKALDLKLDRFVALKFLPPHLNADRTVKRRFLLEAKAASTLDHHNICNIHSLEETPAGELFICMAYYEGVTLKKHIERSPMRTEDVVRISINIAEGLACGHIAGITHRDIKPANIMVTRRGDIKILDYGLVKLADGPKITRDGITVGTPAYMSPEQLKRGDVDHRTDIWSLGIVMYEMLRRRLPFSGSDEIAIACSITNTDPHPIPEQKTPEGKALKRIIERALVKNRNHRYQNLKMLLDDLRAIYDSGSKENVAAARLQSAEEVEIPSLAILPFSDWSDTRDQSYFCDGLTEELTSLLSRLEGLRVASRTSSFQYRDRDRDIRDIGQELNVQHLLEGSIRKSGNIIRISVQLTDVSSGFNIWSEKYERELADIFLIQDEIAQAIVSTLRRQMNRTSESNSQILRRYRPDIAAHNNYLKGRYYWNKRSLRELKKGMRFFRKAIQTDASYALVYVGLADAYNILGMYSAYAPDVVMPKAIKAASRALDIDGQLPEAHIAMACADSIYRWDWERAESAFNKGLSLNARHASGHHWYAINYLTPLGKFDQAIRETNVALELDPVSLPINAALGLHYYFARDYDSAVARYKETLDLDPNFAPAHFFLGQAYVQQSKYEEAMHRFEKAIEIHGESTNMLAAFGYAASLAGREEPALAILGNLLKPYNSAYVSPYDIATLCVGLGYKNKALDWLETAFAERAYLLIYMNVDPVMDTLRHEPRFQELVNKISLE